MPTNSRHLLVALAGAAAGPVAAQPIAYVNAGAAPGGNGQSWNTAFRDLQDALALPAPREVWVVADTYKPDRATANPSMRFVIPSGVAVFGGFLGVETQRDQRDPGAHLTTLSGDLLDNDGPGFANYADNSYTVVVPGVLDGFVICGATAGAVRLRAGGELRNCTLTASRTTEPGAALVYAPTEAGTAAVQNCRFIGNLAATDDGLGGAVYVSGSGLSITGSLFRGNTAEGAGGGAIFGGPVLTDCVFDSNASPEGLGGAVYAPAGRISGCTFVGNVATAGGAVYAGAGTGVLLIDCEFSANHADDGGALYLQQSDRVVRDCIFAGNRAIRGGAVAIEHGDAALIGCTFAGNHGFYGGAANLRGGHPTVLNSRFLGNSTVIPKATGGSGGAIYLRGGAAPAIINTIFSGNRAEAFAGAVAGESLSGGSIVSCTFSLNHSDLTGGGVFVVGPVGLALSNCILWANSDAAGSGPAAQLGGNAPSILRYSTLSGWNGSPAGPGNSAADPGMLDPLGPDLLAGTDDDDLRLSRFSPAIDSADNTTLPLDPFDLNGNSNFNEPVPFDAAGQPRFRDDSRWPNTGAGPGRPSDRGALEFQPPACYPNCDGSTAPPELNVNDFVCFQARFAQSDPYANCDGSTAVPLLTVNDFVCFLGAFAGGCP